MAKPLVTSFIDIEKNILALDKLRKGNQREKKLHARLIKNGKLFIAMKHGRRWLFAPSRFVGYKNNGAGHDKIKNRDGRVTNIRVSNLLGQHLDRNDRGYTAIDKEFLKFANAFGIKSSKHHRPRRYWFVRGRKTTRSPSIFVSPNDPTADIEELHNRRDLSATERKRLISARLGQGQFRRDLINFWGSCAVTGCKIKSALRASHIKPWKDSEKAEKLDPANGLLLLATLDALFDRHLISFKDDGTMLVSKGLEELKPHDQRLLAIGGQLRRRPDKRQSGYLRAHRRIFRK